MANLNSIPVEINDTLTITRITRRGGIALITQVKVSKVTDKAVQVSCGKLNAWFPKAALVLEDHPFFPDHVYGVRVAPWFTVSEWYGKIEDMDATIVG